MMEGKHVELHFMIRRVAGSRRGRQVARGLDDAGRIRDEAVKSDVVGRHEQFFPE